MTNSTISIELVVFDMAGTTVYDGDAVTASFRATLAEAGVAVTPEAIQAVRGQEKAAALRTLLAPRLPAEAITEERVRSLHQGFVARMLDYYATDPAVREVVGASETFRRLRDAGIRVALDSGFSRAIVDVIVARLGWEREGLLDATVASDEVPRGRPHPDMIRLAMERCGVTDPARVAKVGDTPADLQEGQAAGCGMIVGVTAGSHTRDQLLPHPHTHLILTVAELPPLLNPI